MKQTPRKSKDVNKELASFEIVLSKKDSVVECKGEIHLLCVNKHPWFFYYNEKIVPSLKYLQNHNVLPSVVVDMGAIKFVVNGADVMRPGIVEISSFEEGAFIVVVDVNNRKPLAVGIAMLSSEDMEKSNSGKVIRNIHYVGDEIWNYEN